MATDVRMISVRAINMVILILNVTRVPSNGDGLSVVLLTASLTEAAPLLISGTCSASFTHARAVNCGRVWRAHGNFTQCPSV